MACVFCVIPMVWHIVHPVFGVLPVHCVADMLVTLHCVAVGYCIWGVRCHECSMMCVLCIMHLAGNVECRVHCVWQVCGVLLMCYVAVGCNMWVVWCRECSMACALTLVPMVGYMCCGCEVTYMGRV